MYHVYIDILVLLKYMYTLYALLFILYVYEKQLLV